MKTLSECSPVEYPSAHLVTNVSQDRMSQWGLRSEKRPSRVNTTVRPNQYRVKIGRDLNQSWMSDPPPGITAVSGSLEWFTVHRGGFAV